MAVTTNKTLLFLAGGVAAAALVAYGTGAFDPLFKRPSEQIASVPAPATSVAPTGEAVPAGEPAAQEPAATNPPAAAPGETPEAPAGEKAAGEVVPPSFDVVRLESDGSIVVAGKAAPNAQVDLLVGSNVIGSSAAGAGGDFAVVLDEPLKPGDYQIVLRATAPDKVVAMSVETAVVSVPSTPDGQVLALVEEAGKPSHMITMPEPQAPAAAVAPVAPATPDSGANPPAQTPPAAETQAAVQPAEQPAAAQPPTPAEPAVRVEAVEIDGRKIFVAGVTDPGRLVRGYANEILLGDAKASPDGRFLIEIERELPVGDYIIRVDALEPNGDKVVARAAVPFEREPGETIAAVAAPQEAPAAAAPAATPAAEAAAPNVAAGQPAAAPVGEQAAQPQVAQSAQPEVAQPEVAQPATTGGEQSAAADTAASGTPAPANTAPEPQPSQQASAPQPQAIPSAEAPEVPEAAAPAASATDQAAAGQPAAESGKTGEGAPAAQPTPPAAEPQVVAEVPAAPSAGNAGDDASIAASGAAPVAEPETRVATAPEGNLPAPPAADGVTETLAPKLQPVGSAIIIRRGDTLWRISRRVYGQGMRYSTIYLANQTQIEDPNRIWPGQVFKVPEKSADGEVDADYSTLGNRLTTLPDGENETPAPDAQP